MQRYFKVTPPTVHNMVVRLDENGRDSLFPGLFRDGRDLPRRWFAVADLDGFLDESVVLREIGEGTVVDIEGAPLFRGEQGLQFFVERGQFGLQRGEIGVDGGSCIGRKMLV